MACVVALAGCGESLHDAIARGDLSTVRAMVTTDPRACDRANDLGKRPIHYAVNFARPEILEYLIDAGCDINVQDTTGMTPLHVAAFIDLPGAAKMLIGSGATLETRDAFGDTPLHTAAMQGATRVIRVLLAAGADLTAENRDGRTAADLARVYGRDEAASLLVEGVRARR